MTKTHRCRTEGRALARPLSRGLVHKRLDALRERRDALLGEMRAVMTEYDATFRMPRLIHLRLTRSGVSPSLRWRLPGCDGNQPFIRLYQCDAGREVLAKAPPATRRLLARFERTRNDLNTEMGVIATELANGERYLAALEALEEFEAEEAAQGA